MKKIITILLLCLSFLGYSQKLEANNHKKTGIPVTFDICLSYGICSFNFTEDREAAKSMRFFHDKVVMRMKDLGNITFIEECNSGISDFRAYIWQLTMERIAQADNLILVGEKFRSSLQGTVLIDDKSAGEVVRELINSYNECQF